MEIWTRSRLHDLGRQAWSIRLDKAESSIKVGLKADSSIKIGRNTPILALLNLGESHHHNHHLNPKDPNFGKRWFELDIAYQTLRLLTLTGFAQMKNRKSK